MQMMNQRTPFVDKISAFMTLIPEELSALGNMKCPQRSFVAGCDLMHEGQINPGAFILIKGWAISYKVLRGGGRQIVDFQIPGNFLGLRSLLLRTADHNIEPITAIIAAEINMQQLLATFQESSRLAAAILWALSSEEAVAVERLVSLGRRDAVERVAHFFLEFNTRLKMVGLANDRGYACPLSQYHLADALGLSAVHINRVLRQLREENLMTFRGGKVTFEDYNGLVGLADFNASYLGYPEPLLA